MQRFVFVDRTLRDDGSQQQVILGHPTGGIALRVLTALLTLGGGALCCGRGLALIDNLDGLRCRTHHLAFDCHLGRADGKIARLFGQEHEGVGYVDALGHRAVDDLNRLTARYGRPGQQVKALERRGTEGILFGFGVEGKLHAEGFTQGNRQWSLDLQHGFAGTEDPKGRQCHPNRQDAGCNFLFHIGVIAPTKRIEAQN